MYTQNVTINNEVGLHARPATFFIQKANEFKSGIWLEKDERRVNAKSLLGVLSLGIVKGTTITLLADGAAGFLLLPGDVVHIRRDRTPVLVVRMKPDSFYEVVRSKLQEGEGHEAQTT